MPSTSTVVLHSDQIKEKINRLAYQLYEDFADDKEIILAGIAENGYILAQRIAVILKKISGLSVELVKIELDKKNLLARPAKLSIDVSKLKNSSVVVIDDVLNSGKTLIYALRPFLDGGAKKIRTVVLADRSHKQFPISADFTGLSIATTLQEHITVVFENGNDKLFLD